MKLVDKYNRPLEVQLSNFRHKSLSNFNCNISIGCGHGCRFCYVPGVSQRFKPEWTKQYGIPDPDAAWGDYVLLRPWDSDAFVKSVKAAERKTGLPVDGHRAVMFCSTTDAYQTLGRTGDGVDLNAERRDLVRNALRVIRDESTLNVRILTRSPLAREDFGLMQSFGTRLTFGMSLPTLDNTLARIYEPNAPAPTKRLETLKAAKAAGLHVYVAVAPTYPECDEADIRRTLEAVAEIKPITAFYEPINLRGQNVDRIGRAAEEAGQTLDLSPWVSDTAWREYSFQNLFRVQRIAEEVGLLDVLHLWPDNGLLSKAPFMRMWSDTGLSSALPGDRAFDQISAWVSIWHARISEWPGSEPVGYWSVPRLDKYPAISILTNRATPGSEELQDAA